MELQDKILALMKQQGAPMTAGEVEKARSIYNIDDISFKLDGCERCGNGNLTLNLLRVIVADGGAVRNLAKAVCATGKEEQALSERCFAVSTVSKQANVADLINGIGHTNFSPLFSATQDEKTSSHFVQYTTI